MRALAEDRRVVPLRPELQRLEQAQGPVAAPLEADSAWRNKNVYRWLSAYSAALVSARQEFGGDLDRLVIYLVFVLAELSSRKDGRAAGINRSSVADITLVPRETTRRKLHELAESGHLRRDADGLWYLGDSVNCDAWVARASGLFERELQTRLSTGG